MNDLANQLHFEGAQLVITKQGMAESYDARFLISTLLVYVAKGDGSISGEESNRMVDLLVSKMHIRGAEALEHLSNAIMTLSNNEDIVKTLQDVSRGLSTSERDDVFSMMLDVMMIDGVLDPGEINAITIAAQILGLAPDVIHARMRSASSKS